MKWSGSGTLEPEDEKQRRHAVVVGLGEQGPVKIQGKQSRVADAGAHAAPAYKACRLAVKPVDQDLYQIPPDMLCHEPRVKRPPFPPYADASSSSIQLAKLQYCTHHHEMHHSLSTFHCLYLHARNQLKIYASMFFFLLRADESTPSVRASWVLLFNPWCAEEADEEERVDGLPGAQLRRLGIHHTRLCQMTAHHERPAPLFCVCGVPACLLPRSCKDHSVPENHGHDVVTRRTSPVSLSLSVLVHLSVFPCAWSSYA